MFNENFFSKQVKSNKFDQNNFGTTSSFMKNVYFSSEKSMLSYMINLWIR